MKNSKSFLTLMTFAFVFACVMSCDEQDVKLDVNNSLVENDIVKPADGRMGTIELNGSEGDPIELETALRWTQNYRAGLKTAEEHRAHFFGYQIIEEILKQESCVGIRIYYSLDDEGKRQLVIVGVNAQGDDILPLPGGRSEEDGDGGIVADASLPCPTYCSSTGL